MRNLGSLKFMASHCQRSGLGEQSSTLTSACMTKTTSVSSQAQRSCRRLLPVSWVTMHGKIPTHTHHNLPAPPSVGNIGGGNSATAQLTAAPTVHLRHLLLSPCILFLSATISRCLIDKDSSVGLVNMRVTRLLRASHYKPSIHFLGRRPQGDGHGRSTFCTSTSHLYLVSSTQGLS